MALKPVLRSNWKDAKDAYVKQLGLPVNRVVWDGKTQQEILNEKQKGSMECSSSIVSIAAFGPWDTVSMYSIRARIESQKPLFAQAYC